MGNTIHFRLRNWCSWVNVEDFETENVSTRGLEPPTFGFMPYVLNISVIRARHLLFRVFLYWFWRYRYFFIVNWTLEMSTVRGQHNSFSTHARMWLVKVSTFWDKKCIDVMELMPNTQTSYQGQFSETLIRRVWAGCGWLLLEFVNF